MAAMSPILPILLLIMSTGSSLGRRITNVEESTADNNSNFLMLVGGIKSYSSVEVVSLFPGEEPVPECMKNLNTFPIDIRSPAAASLQPGSQPLICGGFGIAPEGDIIGELSTCRTYNFSSDSWLETGELPRESDLSASDYHPSWGLVVSGGYDSNGTTLDEVFTTFDGVTVSTLEERLPVAMFRHCLTVVDEETLFVAGGVGTEERAYLYSKSSRTWTRVGDLPTPRQTHNCGFAKETEEIVVAGGYDVSYRMLDSVEIFNLGTKTWRTAARMLRTKLTSASTVRHGESFLLVGGLKAFYRLEISDKIYKYEPKSESFTMLEGNLVNGGRYFTAAVLVERQSFPGCKQ